MGFALVIKLGKSSFHLVYIARRKLGRYVDSFYTLTSARFRVGMCIKAVAVSGLSCCSEYVVNNKRLSETVRNSEITVRTGLTGLMGI